MSLYTETILPPHHDRALPRWLVAALIVLALHIGIGAYLILTRQIGMPPGQPPDALMINLAPVTASPPQPQEQEQHETVPEEPAVMSKPLQPPPPVPTILETPLIPHPEVVLPPKPVPQKKVEEEKPKKVEREKHQRVERSHPTHLQSRHATAPAPGFNGESEASWLSEVRERIEAAKSYPDDARPAEGTAVLSFVVDANGRVVGVHIARSSGSAALDRATIELAHRIGQLPPPPNGRMPISVPIRYAVR